jgi:hypothetical protein
LSAASSTSVGQLKGERGRHEDQDRPLAAQRLVGDLDELAVAEGLRLERSDGAVDQLHVEPLVGVVGGGAAADRAGSMQYTN